MLHIDTRELPEKITLVGGSGGHPEAALLGSQRPPFLSAYVVTKLENVRYGESLGDFVRAANLKEACEALNSLSSLVEYIKAEIAKGIEAGHYR